MKSGSDTKRKWPVKRTVVISLFAILSIAAILLYTNLNQLLSAALIKGFNSNVISDVYELKFEKLRINIFEGSVRVFNVTLQPREKPLRHYPYINSSMRLTTERITLKNISIVEMIKSGKLNLERISIIKPDIELRLGGKKNRLVPLLDSTRVASPAVPDKKKPIESFNLHEFHLVDASIHTVNEDKQREFKIKKFNISFYDLFIRQITGMDSISIQQAELSLGEFTGSLNKGPIRHVSFADYSVKVDSLNIQQTMDTLVYSFHDFSGGLKALSIQTADSIFHVTMQSFDLSYKDKSVKLKEVSFKPNVSHAVLQKKHQYQNVEFSGSVGSIDLNQVNFDSLIYAKKLFIDEIALEKVTAYVFKDKTKPLDKNRFPVYLGQTISKIPLPLRIKHVKATRVHLENTERKPDSTYVKVNITKATLDVKNITNQPTNTGLLMSADAYIENKAHFKASLIFYYNKPQFSFEAVVQKFNLPDLNPMIQAYTPAKIDKGTLDEITFSGLAEQTKANGTLKFLYHDLKIDLELKEQAKWKSAVIAFAANSILSSSNPGSTNLPPRIVKFQIDRDMNKGFVNVIIKSLLNGLKETMIMSKENKKAYKESKKKRKQEKNK
jgi:hypothetical protein